MTDHKLNNKSAAFLLTLFLAAAAFLWLAVLRGFSLEDVQQVGKSASSLGRTRPVLIFAALAGAQAAGMVLSLPSKALLTMLAGALLGPTTGAICTLCGVLTGTSALFAGARHIFRDRFDKRLGARAKSIQKKLSTHPIRTVAGLRMVITLPYGIITLAAALSPIRYRDFVIGSLGGDLPVVILYSLAGERLALIDSVSDALSPLTAVILAAAGLALVVGSLFRLEGRGRAV